jgi:hypothetical protein
MKYIVICDYPYNTVKHYFETNDEAIGFTPARAIGWGSNRFLQSRVYELSKYSIDDKGVINYTIKWD